MSLSLSVGEEIEKSYLSEMAGGGTVQSLIWGAVWGADVTGWQKAQDRTWKPSREGHPILDFSTRCIGIVESRETTPADFVSTTRLFNSLGCEQAESEKKSPEQGESKDL